MSAAEQRRGRWWETALGRKMHAAGIRTRRGFQGGPGGGGNAPDRGSEDLPLWIECKSSKRGAKKVDVHAALLQADLASSCVIGRSRRPPAVAAADEGQRPYVAMYLHDFLDLITGRVPGLDLARLVEAMVARLQEGEGHE